MSATAGVLLDWSRAGDGPPAMSERLFEHWAELVRERTGMCLPRQRKSFLATNLVLRMRELGLNGYAEYQEYLACGQAGPLEWEELIDRLTVHETRFFRDPQALAFVAEVFLPQALARVREGHSVHVWSAGCSTGEEAYSLAMMLDRHLAEGRQRPYYGVVGSDLSLRSLSIARQGRYAARRLATVPEGYRGYCESGPAGDFHLAERLRRRACFMRTNLLACDGAPLPEMDLVYCQNVLIYFDREHRRGIVERLLSKVRPGGYLVLGAGEILGLGGPAVRRVGEQGVLAFQRLGTAGVGCITV